ncbi:hypothetical protein H8K90_08605 [Winogradskyella echinorum]|uniref:Uncharacterized protein n=1 Tax=Winogradskyella echinorum TaxID=538189 RepID=A0ABR6Y2H7_9FLAO|nr:hypothetical protein [Winogradskyella echinorum]MBC3846438.1 hypothetical protein [Winogradskyella echinorum]MBC5750786.1 hypothetical protein [Winogradskyella echinorum]
MNVIEKLKYHEEDELEEWLNSDDKESRKFLKELVKYSKDNLNEIRQHCVNTIPSEFSSLSIIYEAFSEYSIDFNEFLFEEIQRVVKLAKSKRIKPKYLQVLTDIETEDIYSKTENIYIAIMEFLTSNLNLQNEPNFNVELLDVVSWYLIELDEDDEILESNKWISRITELANNADVSVKIKAREVLKELDISSSLNPLSFFEKLKGMFK